MARKVTLWRFRCDCDAATTDSYHPTKREALERTRSQRQECRQSAREYAELYEQPYRPPACDKIEDCLSIVQVTMTKEGIANALTFIPAR